MLHTPATPNDSSPNLFKAFHNKPIDDDLTSRKDALKAKINYKSIRQSSSNPQAAITAAAATTAQLTAADIIKAMVLLRSAKEEIRNEITELNDKGHTRSIEINTAKRRYEYLKGALDALIWATGSRASSALNEILSRGNL